MKSSHSSGVSWDYFLFRTGELKCIDKYLAVTSKTRQKVLENKCIVSVVCGFPVWWGM